MMHFEYITPRLIMSVSGWLVRAGSLGLGVEGTEGNGGGVKVDKVMFAH